ncbi:ETC complex I subunit [Afifella sp. H1R]|uniref:ETC complex I subunit n=1 Tax=Afifella sp. H1R TaxID=2908841 RepID=UPI001F319D8B|nr:ETC complex I subunit [Afifella sp. H1R]MCF1503096.1 ETC complex I subunit [Afifella sp. H1R]
MQARIYKPARTAMSSGQAKTHEWILEFEPETPRSIEPLMGYTASSDMRSQVRLRFPSKEEAVAYAQRNKIAYRVYEPKEKKRATISYSDNFKFNRQVPWTH